MAKQYTRIDYRSNIFTYSSFIVQNQLIFYHHILGKLVKLWSGFMHLLRNGTKNTLAVVNNEKGMALILELV